MRWTRPSGPQLLAAEWLWALALEFRASCPFSPLRRFFAFFFSGFSVVFAEGGRNAGFVRLDAGVCEDFLRI